MGQCQKEAPKNEFSHVCYTSRKRHPLSKIQKRDPSRRFSAPAQLQGLDTTLDEILNGVRKTKNSKKEKKFEQEMKKLQTKNAYFQMIDGVQLDVCSLSQSKDDFKHLSQRTIRKKDLKDTALLEEYNEYRKATGEVVKPVTLEEFAYSIRPLSQSGLYEGVLDS